MTVELKAAGATGILVERDGEPIGRVWWNAHTEQYDAAT